MTENAALRCVLWGDGTLIIRCAEALLGGGHEILAIISADAPVVRWTKERDLEAIDPRSDVFRALSDQPFEYLFSVNNLSIVPADILSLPRRFGVNFHDGPLPKYSGFHATSWALMNQEREHGVTWHVMTDRVDAGDILKQSPVPISEGETAFTLNAKCYEAAIDAFTELVAELAENRASRCAQNLADRTYFGRQHRPPAACVIDWNRSAAEIDAFVRALDFGPYPNPLGTPKILLGDSLVVVRAVQVGGAGNGAPPGTIAAISDEALQVSTARGQLGLLRVVSLDGWPLPIPELVSRFGLSQGDRLPRLDREDEDELTRGNASISEHEAFWVERLATRRTYALPFGSSDREAGKPGRLESFPVPIPSEALAFLGHEGTGHGLGEFLLSAFAAYLVRLGEDGPWDIGFCDASWKRGLIGLDSLFAPSVPLRVGWDKTKSFRQAWHAVSDELRLIQTRGRYAVDAVLRYPQLAALRGSREGIRFPVVVERPGESRGPEAPSGAAFRLVIPEDPRGCHIVYDQGVLEAGTVARMAEQYATFMKGIVADPDRPIAEVPLLDQNERHRILVDWNATGADYPEDQCVHTWFERQVTETPDAVAVVFRNASLTYRELNARANRLARHLRSFGVGPEILVGICIEPSLEVVVGLLGILKAGAAYVPLDPSYPRERLSFILSDARAPVLLAQERLVGKFAGFQGRVVRIDADEQQISRCGADDFDSGVSSGNLAYVIYTSGSTGVPKGVMIEHRNVANLFAAMDRVLGSDPPGVWLAVTSISFDISVLELFWTLARGFRVILPQHHGEIRIGQPRSHAEPVSRDIDFSLFYFASDEREATAEKYRLLVEGAKFADRNGFAAVWTPERHFHAFGGLYPNPSVTSAAIAAVTERVRIRAGSVVLPLHDPIRVAEEWSLVDNLSNGRVGISFASGWHADDFLLAPENYADRKAIMMRKIETVRGLWRGEAVSRVGGTGSEVQVRTLPRPIQPELPVWLTAAGSPDTFRMAGEIGAGVLTHLLGQSLEELAEKIAVYRNAWQQAGHASAGHVTLMLHTFLGEDGQAVREKVRKPFSDYLRSSADLIKKSPWQFPTVKSPSGPAKGGMSAAPRSAELTDEDIDALVAHAFDRYFETSGLFGTPQDCVRMIEKIRAIGVDEVACLIDFGVDAQSVLDSLQHLDALRQRVQAEGESLPELIRRHGVSHLQCTPTMARMFAMAPESLSSLGDIRQLLLGGEALPVSLANQVGEAMAGQVRNMYGPTETTVWSTTQRLEKGAGSVPIGRPIANTQIYILDGRLEPVPVGVPGELYIGGAGLARGYWNRPELTAERFVSNPFSTEPGSRLYKTGDLARYLPDGKIEFLGRLDHQVKVRGFRIELGEVETALAQLSGVREAVVVAREDEPSQTRLVAYWVASGESGPNVSELRAFLTSRLPEYMVPSAFVRLEALPLTPNGKLDRKALPAPDQTRPELEEAFVAPRTPTEQVLAEIWCEVLGLKQVGIHDDFFDLGGHSLLATQVIARLRDALGVEVRLPAFFAAPTVAQLALGIVQSQAEEGNRDEMEHLLAELEGISGDEASSRLADASRETT